MYRQQREILTLRRIQREVCVMHYRQREGLFMHQRQREINVIQNSTLYTTEMSQSAPKEIFAMNKGQRDGNSQKEI